MRLALAKTGVHDLQEVSVPLCNPYLGKKVNVSTVVAVMVHSLLYDRRAVAHNTNLCLEAHNVPGRQNQS